MHNNNTIYKDSPLGKIPCDWEVKELEKITEKIGDGLHGTPEYVSSSEYYFINGNNLKDGLVQINADTKCVSKEEYLKHKKELKYKTILLSINGTIGSIAFYKNENIVLGKSAAYINCKDENVDYLYYYLQSQSTVNFFEGELTGSTIRNLSLKSIREIPVSLPPLREQKAIAHVLSLMDSAINTNNQLIEKKELQKKWLMQNLLTGKKRLKGFGLEWKNYRLEYFIEDYNEKPKDEIKYEVLTSAKAGLMKQTDYYGDNRITNREDADYNIIPPNYLTYRSRSDDGLFTFNKNTLGFVGLISGYYPVFTIKNGDLDFILMYCNFYRYKFKKYCIGTSQLVLSMNALKSANFTLPKKEEQTAIAEVLQAANKEIQLLKSKTEKLREQKKWLMQMLLTGKKRFKIANTQ
ncbi:MAG TPA: restriction endonuclease subunit S [Bacteroidales bacterium]|nr:restriction endonuclease subunit S [Bacteroidales bacterium]